MTVSIILACIWGLVANVAAMLPSRDNHWRFAYGMIAIGIPILIGVYVQNGVWAALIVLLAAAWILRWPVRYFFGWVAGRLGWRKPR